MLRCLLIADENCRPAEAMTTKKGIPPNRNVTKPARGKFEAQKLEHPKTFVNNGLECLKFRELMDSKCLGKRASAMPRSKHDDQDFRPAAWTAFRACQGQHPRELPGRGHQGTNTNRRYASSSLLRLTPGWDQGRQFSSHGSIRAATVCVLTDLRNTFFRQKSLPLQNHQFKRSGHSVKRKLARNASAPPHVRISGLNKAKAKWLLAETRLEGLLGTPSCNPVMQAETCDNVQVRIFPCIALHLSWDGPWAQPGSTTSRSRLSNRELSF